MKRADFVALNKRTGLRQYDSEITGMYLLGNFIFLEEFKDKGELPNFRLTAEEKVCLEQLTKWKTIYKSASRWMSHLNGSLICEAIQMLSSFEFIESELDFIVGLVWIVVLDMLNDLDS